MAAQRSYPWARASRCPRARRSGSTTFGTTHGSRWSTMGPCRSCSCVLLVALCGLSLSLLGSKYAAAVVVAGRARRAARCLVPRLAGDTSSAARFESLVRDAVRSAGREGSHVNEIILMWAAVSIYTLGSILFVFGTVFRKDSIMSVALWVTLAGLVPHTIAIGMRWVPSATAPTSGSTRWSLRMRGHRFLRSASCRGAGRTCASSE